MKILIAKRAFYSFRSFWLCIVSLFSNLWRMDWEEAKYDFWQIRHKITYPFYNFYRQMKCLWSYLPILWADRDWDWAFFLYLIQHKLRRMEKAIRKGGHTRSKNDADNIKSCLIVLKRMIDNKYEDEAQEMLNKKWGKAKHEDVLCEENGETCYEWKMSYPGVTTEEQEKQHSKDYRKYHKIAEKKQQADFDKLFRLLAQKLRYWWD